MYSSELKFFGLKQSRFELSGLLKNSEGVNFNNLWFNRRFLSINESTPNRQEKLIKIVRFQYEWDGIGKWIKKIVFEDGKPILFIEREMFYY